MKKYFNAENITTFVIVVLAAIAAPFVLNLFMKAKDKVSASNTSH